MSDQKETPQEADSQDERRGSDETGAQPDITLDEHEKQPETTPPDESKSGDHGDALHSPTAAVEDSILYRVRWSDRYDMLLKTFESGKQFDGFHVTDEGRNFDAPRVVVEDDTPRRPALEIVKNIIGSSGDRKEEDIKTVGEIALNTIKGSTIIVRSQPLLRLLRTVIDYYPEQALSGTSVSFLHPYPAILHHYNELKAILKNRPAENQGEDQVEPIHDREAHAHLDLMLTYLDPLVEKILLRLEPQLAKENPVIAFEDLWYMFKPGTDVYVTPKEGRSGPDISGVVVSSRLDTEEQPIFYTSEPVVKAFILQIFNLESDGEKLSRQRVYVTIPAYKGERGVASLPVFPASHIDLKDQGVKRATMERDGKSCWDIIQAGPKHMLYSGPPLRPDGEESNSIPSESGSLVVDLLSHVRYGGGDNDLAYWTWLTDPVRDVKDKWQSYTNIPVKGTAELTPHQYFLLVKCLPGFVTKDKNWHTFHIGQLTHHETEPRAMRNLIIKSEHLDIIRAVCDAKVSSWKIDFIESKGEGSIILLHGPPGVGKTFTVEAFAKEANRPLLQLTIADIGLEDDAIESKLTKWFNLAEAWNGILLLDEADIFMEQRTHGQTQRNALVSVFLRLMEYFKGVFFLTTNRIGNIDDAFLSRVYVVIGYDELDDAKRELIWRGFWKKLKQDMDTKKTQGSTEPRVEIDHYAMQYVLSDQKVRDLRWNGREIRNALSTAVSLARYQTLRDPSRSREGYIDVGEGHFKSVVNMSKSFKDYMHSIRNADEPQRARQRKDRNDFLKESTPSL